MNIHLRKLELGDAAALLAFELENRDWFEQFVEARAADFYTPAGIMAHIQSNLADHQRRVMHPCLVLDDNEVLIGRANLRCINTLTKTCDLGYRIGCAHIGHGVATLAVEQLKMLARKQWRLERMTAYVSIENPASIRVLEKNGFVKHGLFPELSVIQERLHDCYEFVHWLE